MLDNEKIDFGNGEVELEWFVVKELQAIFYLCKRMMELSSKCIIGQR